jgi:predicted Rossmann fold flavoprotein
LDDVAAKISTGGKSPKNPRLESRGGFLWTHFGCSGPVPMNVSRFVSVLDQPHQASLQLDLLPHLSGSELQACFDPARQGRRQVAKVVQSLIPRSLASCLLERAELAEGTTLAELTKRGRRSLLGDLKNLSIPLSGTRGYAKAEVTRGGVEKREINPHTLESRIAPGLFLAGEIIDLDGPIGGYNFQAAFSTGHTAALHV